MPGYCFVAGCQSPPYGITWLADLQEHIIPAVHCKPHHELVPRMDARICGICQALPPNNWRRPDPRLQILKRELV